MQLLQNYIIKQLYHLLSSYKTHSELGGTSALEPMSSYHTHGIEIVLTISAFSNQRRFKKQTTGGLPKKGSPPSKMAYLVYNDYK